MRTVGLAAGAMLLGAVATAWAQQAPEVPVMVGEIPDMDACMSLGQVTGLDPAGDNFLAVRAAPDAGAAEIDRLGPGDLVSLCDQQGRWLGVVYDDGDGSLDCGVGTPRPHEPYAGPCRSGWVFEAYVEVIAG